MWIFSIAAGVVLLTLGLVRSYYRMIAVLLVVTVAGGIALAMMNDADAQATMSRAVATWG